MRRAESGRFERKASTTLGLSVRLLTITFLVAIFVGYIHNRSANWAAVGILFLLILVFCFVAAIRSHFSPHIVELGESSVTLIGRRVNVKMDYSDVRVQRSLFGRGIVISSASGGGQTYWISSLFDRYDALERELRSKTDSVPGVRQAKPGEGGRDDVSQR